MSSKKSLSFWFHYSKELDMNAINKIKWEWEVKLLGKKTSFFLKYNKMFKK